MALAMLYLLGLFSIGVPIALALGMAPLPALYGRGMPLIIVPQTVFEALDSFALMAIPFFVLAGRLMQTGGIARRLVELAVAIVGWMRGGLASSAVLTSMFFATISGSSSATAAAIGTVLIPEMERQKYPRPFAAAVVASSGELGVIIPPSVPMVIYAVLTSVSVTDLFIAGILPGVLIGVSLIGAISVVATLKGYGTRKTMSLAQWLRGIAMAGNKAALSLLLPVIILGGIYGGYFTATEAAVVAVAYAFVLGVFVYGEIKLRDLPGIFSSAAITSAVVLIIVGFASVFAHALAVYQAPQQVARLILDISHSPLVFLLIVNIFLFVVGMFMETFAAIIILAPVLAPIAVSLGIDPVHFATVMIVNLAVGMVTPPVGVNLFVACGIAKIRMEQLMRPLSIFLGVLVVDLMIITYVPKLSLALIR